jgi:hypothetical protein
LPNDIVWWNSQESTGFPAHHFCLHQVKFKFCVGPMLPTSCWRLGPGPKRQRTALQELRAWADQWPVPGPVQRTLDSGNIVHRAEHVASLPYLGSTSPTPPKSSTSPTRDQLLGNSYKSPTMPFAQGLNWKWSSSSKTATVSFTQQWSCRWSTSRLKLLQNSYNVIYKGVELQVINFNLNSYKTLTSQASLFCLFWLHGQPGRVHRNVTLCGDRAVKCENLTWSRATLCGDRVCRMSERAVKCECVFLCKSRFHSRRAFGKVLKWLYSIVERYSDRAAFFHSVLGD